MARVADEKDDRTERAAFAKAAPAPESASLMAYSEIVSDEPTLMVALPVREKEEPRIEDPQSTATTTDDEAIKKEHKRDGARARAVRTVMDRRIKQAEETVARAADRRSKESIDAAKERLEYAKKLQEEAHKDEQSLLISEEAATEAVAVIERIVREEDRERKDDDERESDVRE
jgi:hypothetical protein